MPFLAGLFLGLWSIYAGVQAVKAFIMLALIWWILSALSRWK